MAKKIVLAVVAACACIVVYVCSQALSLGAYTFEGGAVAVSEKTVVVTLEGNPTTGFQWTDIMAGDNNVKLTDSNYESSSNLNGAGGVYSFKYEGIQGGTAVITYTYARSWESVAPEKEITVEITTSFTGKVTHTKVTSQGRVMGESSH